MNLSGTYVVLKTDRVVSYLDFSSFRIKLQTSGVHCQLLLKSRIFFRFKEPSNFGTILKFFISFNLLLLFFAESFLYTISLHRKSSN